MAIPHGAHPDTDPVRLVRAWRALLATHGITTGPLLRSVDRHGHLGASLSGDGLAYLVRDAVHRAGLPEPQRYSAHSLRAGGATAAYQSGAPRSAIAEHGGWAQLSPVMDTYWRAVDRWRTTPSPESGCRPGALRGGRPVTLRGDTPQRRPPMTRMFCDTCEDALDVEIPPTPGEPVYCSPECRRVGYSRCHRCAAPLTGDILHKRYCRPLLSPQGRRGAPPRPPPGRRPRPPPSTVTLVCQYPPCGRTFTAPRGATPGAAGRRAARACGGPGCEPWPPRAAGPVSLAVVFVPPLPTPPKPTRQAPMAVASYDDDTTAAEVAASVEWQLAAKRRQREANREARATREAAWRARCGLLPTPPP